MNNEDQIRKVLKLLDEHYPTDKEYKPTISAEKQQEVISKLQASIDFEQCFFVFDLINRRIENVSGFMRWFGYPDEYFNVKSYFGILHPDFIDALNINAKAAFDLANKPDTKVEFMDSRLAANLALKHNNGNYLYVKRTLYPFQIDEDGSVTSYLNHFTILSKYQKESKATIRPTKGNEVESSEIEEQLKLLREKALEFGGLKNLFSKSEWKVLIALSENPEFSHAEIAESLGSKIDTIKKTHNHRILRKANTYFVEKDFKTLKELAIFFRDNSLV